MLAVAAPGRTSSRAQDLGMFGTKRAKNRISTLLGTIQPNPPAIHTVWRRGRRGRDGPLEGSGHLRDQKGFVRFVPKNGHFWAWAGEFAVRIANGRASGSTPHTQKPSASIRAWVKSRSCSTGFYPTTANDLIQAAQYESNQTWWGVGMGVGPGDSVREGAGHGGAGCHEACEGLSAANRQCLCGDLAAGGGGGAN